MNHMGKTLQITRTAVFIALLVVLQAVTAPLGNTIITGTLVNAVLIVSVMACGIWSGGFTALISPVMAKLVGIGPLWTLIPFIALGNMTHILAWHFLGKRLQGTEYVKGIVSLFVGAWVKFAVLYLGIVRLAVPLLLRLPEPQAAVVSGMFSLPQLVTALLGGAVALPILAALKKWR